MKLRRASKLRIVHSDPNVELQSKLDALQNKYNNLLNTPEKIVDKVVYKDDPKLLEKYNAAMKELGILKGLKKDPTIETKVVYEQGETRVLTKYVNKRNYIEYLAAILLGAAITLGGVYINKPKEQVKNVLPVKKSK